MDGVDFGKLTRSEPFTAEWLEALFSDRTRFLVLSAKANIEDWQEDMVAPEQVHNLLEYFTSLGMVKCSSLGVHTQGKSGKPHFHLHVVIVGKDVPKTLLSNASTHRARWCKTSGKPLGDVSIRVQPMSTDPVINVLSYPLKERQTFADGLSFLKVSGTNLPEHFIDLIKDYGNGLFQKAQLDQSYRDRHEAKRQCLRTEIAELVDEHKPGNLDELYHLIDEVFLPSKETIHEVPVARNLKDAVIQVALHKRLISFHEWANYGR